MDPLQLSGSYHSPSPLFSPQNNFSTQQSNENSLGVQQQTPTDNRPITPNEDSSHQRSQTPAEDRTAPRNAQLDRNNDAVYAATTSVVKAIMELSRGVENAATKCYLEMVKNVGVQLRTLLASVDELSGTFPTNVHK